MPEKQEIRQGVRKRAKKAAAGAGRKWAELSKEDRKPFLRAARKTAKNASGPKTVALGAKKAAERAGETWANLTKEQRQAFRKKARVAAKGGERKARGAKTEA